MIPGAGRLDLGERRRVIARRPWTAIFGTATITWGTSIVIVAGLTRRADNAVFGAIVLLIGAALFAFGVGRR